MAVSRSAQNSGRMDSLFWGCHNGGIGLPVLWASSTAPPTTWLSPAMNTKKNKFIICYDTERCPTATSTGFNAAKGELITLSMKGLSNTHQRASVFVHHDVIIELRDTGADVLV